MASDPVEITIVASRGCHTTFPICSDQIQVHYLLKIGPLCFVCPVLLVVRILILVKAYAAK